MIAFGLVNDVATDKVTIKIGDQYFGVEAQVIRDALMGCAFVCHVPESSEIQAALTGEDK